MSALSLERQMEIIKAYNRIVDDVPKELRSAISKKYLYYKTAQETKYAVSTVKKICSPKEMDRIIKDNHKENGYK